MSISNSETDDAENGDGGDGSGGVPGDLYSAALAHAKQLEASGERCSPGDAEKVLVM